MLKSVIAAVCIGMLGGFWIALVDGSIEIFQNYVDGVWRYQVEFNSVAELLVGAVIGALAGANIRLALDPERADGFVSGALVGLAVGVLLALAQIAFVVLSALLKIYDVEYGFLLTRFSGIIAAAALIGAIAGLLKSRFSLAAPLPSGVVGALVAIAFVMPIVMGAALTIPIADWGAPVGGAFSSTYLTPHLPVLLACAGTGAIVAAVAGSRMRGHPSDMLTSAGVVLGAVVSATVSSLSFHYVILGLASPEDSFSIAMFAFRTLVGLLGGVAVGMAVIIAGRRIVSTHRTNAGMISPD